MDDDPDRIMADGEVIDMILKSDHPAAQEFRFWLITEVIRQTRPARPKAEIDALINAAARAVRPSHG
jgi:hypothetical protein